MKKKNKKLLNFWNKIKKPLMILSVVVNFLFILFLILGSIGVKKNKTQCVYADDTISSLANVSLVLNDSLTTSANENYYLNFYTSSGDYYTQFLLEKWTTNSVVHTALSFGNDEFDDPDDYITDRVYDNGWVYPYTYKSLIFVDGEDINNSNLIQWLILNSDLSSGGDEDDDTSFFVSSFTFNRNFNYNAPFLNNIDSPFISGFSNNQGIFKEYSFPLFMSNGQFFNTIRLRYEYGSSVRYIDSDGIIHINENQTVGYYGYMQYVNTLTSTSKLVNTRNFRTEYVSTDNSTQTFLDFGSTWVNNDYQNLFFSDVLTSTQIDNLAQFNNAYYENGFNNVSTDAGLGNVFTLLGGAFGSLASIFAIQLLPNITLGLLFFLPLIVGIIIFIIWLIKR